MSGALAEKRFCRPRRLVELKPLIAVSLKEALYRDHQIGPHCLRTGIAAPDAASNRGDEEQRQRCKHQQASDVVKLLRPDLDEEEIEAPRGKIDEHGLIGKIGATIPANPRDEIVDAERHRHHDPLDGAEAAMRALGIDLDAGRIKAPA